MRDIMYHNHLKYFITDKINFSAMCFWNSYQQLSVTQSEDGLHSPLVLLAVLLDTDEVLCIAIALCSAASGWEPRGMAWDPNGPSVSFLSSVTMLSVSLAPWDVVCGDYAYICQNGQLLSEDNVWWKEISVLVHRVSWPSGPVLFWWQQNVGLDPGLAGCGACVLKQDT